MRKVTLAAAEEGMVLAQPVENSNGITLAGPGTELTEKLISRFKNMGVVMVVVVGEDSISSEEANRQKELIERRFSQAGNSPLWQDLKDVLIEKVEERSS